MQHLHQKVPPQAWPVCKTLVADMRDAPPFEAGQRRPPAFLCQYQATFPEARRWLADAVEASLNHLQGPARHRHYVRTSNLAARAFAEERRRTKVMPISGMKPAE
jgi:transposase-like protein